jgi:2-oxoglutarate dehydrogenase E2 component (dihydrolipoamide succinyltransferase)
VASALEAKPKTAAIAAAPAAAAPASAPAAPSSAASSAGATRKRMTPLRQRIAQRLVQAQRTAAILTTFNEVDMTACMDLRKKWKEDFEKKHGTSLGFMSFFTAAAVKALQKFPGVNSQIDGTDIVAFDHVHMGIAVGTDKGLVVPVLRNAEKMGFADIEKAIEGYALKAKEGKLTIDDMQGGTFTITNGGVYGSLMSTPIINPPQSGILGMHAIKERPMAVNGQVVIRPMMYIALSYDHRIVDGSEAVGFLVRIKELIEAPERLILGL